MKPCIPVIPDMRPPKPPELPGPYDLVAVSVFIESWFKIHGTYHFEDVQALGRAACELFERARRR